MEADIIVIGAGATGLLAARELSATGRKILVLEGHDRIGGRAHTVRETPYLQPIETGAEFIHGNLELTLQLLKEAGIKTMLANGAVWRSNEGRLFQQDEFMEGGDVLLEALENQEEECSVGDFLETHFSDARYGDLKKSVQGYIEGYYAGELSKASVLALKEEWLKDDEPQLRVQGGYTGLMQYLYEQCIRNGVVFHFSATVRNIVWGFEKVDAATTEGTHFNAQKAVITVPVSVLQHTYSSTAIRFHPRLPEQETALEKLGSGSVIKILLQFKTPFWEEAFQLKRLSFLLSGEAIPTWWTQHPQQASLLVGWCAGPHADALKGETDEALFQKAMHSLARIFNLPLPEIEAGCVAWKVYNWAADPFTQGGYSYLTTASKAALQLLAEPVAQTLFFAGEGMYDNINIGTMEAALQSGKQAAEKVTAAFRQ